MIDSSAIAAASPQAGAGAGGPTQNRQVLDQAETKEFAQLMAGKPPGHPSLANTPSVLGDAAKAYAAQLAGQARPLDEMRRSMLQSINPRDPLMSMVALTNHSMEAHETFVRMHISMGLAGAASSLFNTLLKNQQ